MAFLVSVNCSLSPIGELVGRFSRDVEIIACIGDIANLHQAARNIRLVDAAQSGIVGRQTAIESNVAILSGQGIEGEVIGLVVFAPGPHLQIKPQFRYRIIFQLREQIVCVDRSPSGFLAQGIDAVPIAQIDGRRDTVDRTGTDRWRDKVRILRMVANAALAANRVSERTPTPYRL